jgi:hypothetical protein
MAKLKKSKKVKASVKSVSVRNEKRRAAYAAAKKVATKKRKYTRRAKLAQSDASVLIHDGINIGEIFADQVKADESNTRDEGKGEVDTYGALRGTYLEIALENARYRANLRRETYGNAEVTAADVIDRLYHRGSDKSSRHTRHEVLFSQLTTALSRYISGTEDEAAICDLIDSALELHAFGLEFRVQPDTYGLND